MPRELTPTQLIERSIQKKYRKELWTPFILAVKRYALIQAGDRVAVCVSGGKDSMLLAKLMQLLHRYSDVPFEVRFLAMDPGYAPENRRRIEENARLLDIPITIFETDVFDVANAAEKNPCYLCKIALGHHFNDVIETTVMAMLYGAQLQGMMPKLHSTNFEGMELIRPLYCVHEEDIIAWKRYNRLEFLQCACRFTENISQSGDGVGPSKRQEVKQLLKTLRRDNPDVEKSVFNAIHAVSLDTFPGWKTRGEEHSFLEWYDERG